MAGIQCPTCGEREFGEPRQFNMMFTTHVGPVEDEKSILPAAGDGAGDFTNFKNGRCTIYPDVLFGIAQQGKVLQ
ncbi:hypothetical protein IPL68_04965 [Candidatus Saccharibacteria bacterium]|nr:MAG: hypothetical protein IPL68_04965 [Candidatus Saccharibacteria bacterium]